MRPVILALAVAVTAVAPAAAQTTAPTTSTNTSIVVAADATQSTPQRRQTPARRNAPPPDRLALRGYGMAGGHWFAASSTFKAITGSSSATVLGGGLRLNIPGGAYVDVGAWRYNKDGERVFVAASREAFPLGIPTTIKMVPLEVTAGWRFPNLVGRLSPNIGVGLTSLSYKETADFAASGDDVSGRYNGYHVVGGVEVRLHRWVGLAAELSWTTIGKGLGDGGASKAYGEDDFGGKSARVKLFIGR